MHLEDVAVALRSKNAGPCQLTLDIMLPDARTFAHVRDRLPRLVGLVAGRLGIAEDRIRGFVFEPALAIKLTLPRAVVSGDVGDGDVYGAQQHGALLELDL